MSRDADDTPIRRRKNGLRINPGIILAGLVCATILMIGFVVYKFKTNRKSEPTNVETIVKGGERKQDTKNALPDSGASPRQVGYEGSTDESNPKAFSAFVGGTLCMIVLLALSIAYIVASLLMAIWVVKDCRNRSVENGVFWMLLIFPFNWIALLVYLASRPQGLLVRCEKCGNRRLTFVGICPHCRQPVKAIGRVS